MMGIIGVSGFFKPDLITKSEDVMITIFDLINCYISPIRSLECSI